MANRRSSYLSYARIADCDASVGATTLTLRRPNRRVSLPELLRLNVVRVWEPEPPPGEPAVEWVLLTTEPIATLEDLLRIVDRYRSRWVIEEFFKAIKTGCSYEQRQLGDYESLVNALALFAPMPVS
jgi:IS4 transposase